MPMSSAYPPFRRQTEPALVPVGAAATWFPVPDGFIPPGAVSFRVANPNACWVRLKGFPGDTPDRVTATTGWAFAPGSVEVYATQNPKFMSAMAMDTPAFPIAGLNLVPLELSYGDGA